MKQDRYLDSLSRRTPIVVTRGIKGGDGKTTMSESSAVAHTRTHKTIRQENKT